MPCYRPRQAYVLGYKPNGKLKLAFGIRYANSNFETMPTPCQQCTGCRLEYSRQWAIRMSKHAKMHAHNSFITLTYNSKHLPKDLSLNLDHFQRFMKRLRKKFGVGISYYHCGEYGDKFGRPHYHVILFGIHIKDKVFHKRSKGFDLHTSPTINKIWKKGFAYIGDVTFASAAYVARYVMKKQKGKDAKYLYGYSDLSTGEIVFKKPEYSTMSRNPAIGRTYYDKYRDEIYSTDSIVVHPAKGKAVTLKPPKYFDRLYSVDNPDHFVTLKKSRIEDARTRLDDNTLERLIEREKHKMITLEKLTRQIDMEN